MTIKLPKFESAHVLVVGDAMLDRYWHGDTLRVSSEAPIPIISVNEIEDRAGGAANVALNITTLGARACIVAAVGNDHEAEVLQNKLTSAGIDCSFHRAPGYKTITKLRVLSRKQQLVRADFEQALPVDQAAILNRTRAPLAEANMLVLSDYDKGVIEDARGLITKARAQGVPVLVDPKFKDFSIYEGATILKPNRVELEHAIGKWDSEDQMVEQCKALIQRLGLTAMLVTRGNEGMTLIQSDQPETHFPARTRDVYDVTGAGDTVIAMLATALAAGDSLMDAVGLANIAAGIVVSHSGTAVVSSPELRQEIAADPEYNRGVLSREQAQIAISEARSRGEKVVFTNGCFDILHAGHVDYLTEAKAQGNRLIVAINDDDSVHRLKGEGRPVNTLERRTTMLAGLAAVDWVVPFSEDTPVNLLEELQPDVLVKGGDYSLQEIVGGDIVSGYGGEVRALSFLDECSTTDLVEKIRKLSS